MRKNIPTDKVLLNRIYDLYFDTYIKYDKEKNRRSKIYVPIDIDYIAKKMKVEADIVFGVLYYYLNKKYSYEKKDGNVYLFAKAVGDDINCINFPLLSAIIAELNTESRKYRISIGISIIALIISIFSVIVSISWRQS